MKRWEILYIRLHYSVDFSLVSAGKSQQPGGSLITLQYGAALNCLGDTRQKWVKNT